MKNVSVYRPMNVVDQLMESFFDSSLASTLASVSGNPALNKLPLVDVMETADSYIVEAELPGFDEKQIGVQVEGGKLTIESIRNDEKEETQNTAYLMRERRRISFSRSFTLPENADTESVTAVFKNGILSLQIKKRAETARRHIEISAG